MFLIFLLERLHVFYYYFAILHYCLQNKYKFTKIFSIYLIIYSYYIFSNDYWHYYECFINKKNNSLVQIFTEHLAGARFCRLMTSNSLNKTDLHFMHTNIEYIATNIWRHTHESKYAHTTTHTNIWCLLSLFRVPSLLDIVRVHCFTIAKHECDFKVQIFIQSRCLFSDTSSHFALSPQIVC